MKKIFLAFAHMIFSGQVRKHPKIISPDHMMIRIAEIKIAPVYLTAYLSILKNESKTSLELEPDVLCICPVYQEEDSDEIRIYKNPLSTRTMGNLKLI